MTPLSNIDSKFSLQEAGGDGVVVLWPLLIWRTAEPQPIALQAFAANQKDHKATKNKGK